MSDVWNKMIKEFGKFSDNIAEKSEIYLKKAVNKGEELTKIGKIQLEIETTKRELRKKYESFGNYIVEKNVSENVIDFSLDETFKSKIDYINNLNNLINKLESDKKEIKNSSDLKSKHTDQNKSDIKDQHSRESEEFEL